jgi:hypothetical protein
MRREVCMNTGLARNYRYGVLVQLKKYETLMDHHTAIISHLMHKNYTWSNFTCRWKHDFQKKCPSQKALKIENLDSTMHILKLLKKQTLSQLINTFEKMVDIDMSMNYHQA